MHRVVHMDVLRKRVLCQKPFRHSPRLRDGSPACPFRFIIIGHLGILCRAAIFTVGLTNHNKSDAGYGGQGSYGHVISSHNKHFELDILGVWFRKRTSILHQTSPNYTCVKLATMPLIGILLLSKLNCGQYSSLLYTAGLRLLGLLRRLFPIHLRHNF